MKTCFIFPLSLLILYGCQNNTDKESAGVADSLKYVKQEPPGLTSTLFSPGFISLETEFEFSSVFNEDGTELYYGVNVQGGEEIRYTRLVGQEWTKPMALLPNELGYNDPFLSPNENRLYFISRRTQDGLGQKEDHDIWYLEKINGSWSTPVNAGSNINTASNEYYISFTRDGTMYFSSNRNGSDFDIYYSRYVNEEFQEAIRLSDSINSPHYEADVFVDPDETYVIFCTIRPGVSGIGGDLFISFKKPDDTWTTAVSMGPEINTQEHELCPFVTKDGKYFFYSSDEDIYWIDAQIIEDLRKDKLGNE